MKNKIKMCLSYSWRVLLPCWESNHYIFPILPRPSQKTDEKSSSMVLEMIPVGTRKGVSPLGASAVASIQGTGEYDPSVRLGINEDEASLASSKAISIN